MSTGTSERQRTYVPAAGYDWLLPLFGGTNGIIAHLFHHAHLVDQHRIPALMQEAGFAQVTELAPRDTILGRVSFWRASG